LESAVNLPEGAEVTVDIPPPRESEPDIMPESERRRIREILDRIAALPIEGMTDSFSGADHDKVLYGKP
jgi:hypothetical protein